MFQFTLNLLQKRKKKNVVDRGHRGLQGDMSATNRCLLTPSLADFLFILIFAMSYEIKFVKKKNFEKLKIQQKILLTVRRNF